MKKNTQYLLLALAVFALYSCASSIPSADAVHQKWAQKHWQHIDLADARSIYAANCSGCHALHSPAEHSETEWQRLFAEMAGKAHMSPQDSVSVLAYLETFSRDNRLAD